MKSVAMPTPQNKLPRFVSHAQARKPSSLAVRRSPNMSACEQAPGRQSALIHAWLTKPQFVFNTGSDNCYDIFQKMSHLLRTSLVQQKYLRYLHQKIPLLQVPVGPEPLRKYQVQP